MTMLLAEDLLLLLLDDETGKLDATWIDPLLGGAMLTELAAGELLEVRKGGTWSRAKVHVLPGATPPGDPLLTGALGVVAERERTAQDLVNRLGKGLKDALLARLAERGIIRLEEGRFLGIFPTKRWPTVDSSHEDEVRRHLAAALLHGVTPTQHTAALVSLLHAADRAHKVLDNQGLPARQVKARAKEIAEGDWAAKAVRDAISAAQAATTAVMIATTTAAASSS
ncbi:GPP34 family phosphoprotein [Nocardioides sp. AE5]|uniref:GOLPH3/VPS74 family protein n=1 Tax=Nocardioides sp. AE5 TaxID=2962573 RepID=UPI00288206F9|nr:GPP34 family phosphoprotein [Nocardioides sp. AE5]MDT0202763.1 GPP34 family phosphoprotein [Nocardioides sp. AE5]